MNGQFTQKLALDLVIYLKIMPDAYTIFQILLFGIPLTVSLLLIVLNANSSLHVTQDTFDIFK